MTKLNDTNKKQRSWGDRKSSKSRKINIFYPLLIALVIAILILFYSFNRLNNVINDLNDQILYNKKQSKHISSIPHFVTIVMPSVVNKKGSTSRLNAITETWGPAANAIYILDKNNFLQFPNLNILHHSFINSSNINDNPNMFSMNSFPMRLSIPTQIEETENGFERLQFVIQTLAQPNLFPTTQYFFFVNDHTFVIPDKLCHFLTRFTNEKSNSYPNHSGNDKHLYAGHALKNQKDSFAFNSGASGYILSRLTLESLVKRWKQKDPNCIITDDRPIFFQNNPGLITAKCLQQSLGVSPIDTRYPNKSHIFHAFGIIRTATKMVDSWYFSKHEGLHYLLPNQFSSDYQNVFGEDDTIDSCSIDTISFHYVECHETKALYYIRQYLINRPSLSDKDLKRIIQNKWPDNKENGWIGGYAKPLPRDDDIENWNAIVKTFRKISNSNSICEL